MTTELLDYFAANPFLLKTDWHNFSEQDIAYLISTGSVKKRPEYHVNLSSDGPYDTGKAEGRLTYVHMQPVPEGFDEEALKAWKAQGFENAFVLNGTLETIVFAGPWLVDFFDQQEMEFTLGAILSLPKKQAALTAINGGFPNIVIRVKPNEETANS
ncbi:hypothetical protein [Spirosoma aerolatum]|uniref:hypothetical protein n=1 Tax=Spirosoma aerolatum TaxID=1211326 RepID=UPI0009ACCBB0|nr:hypothetical protein [Spirosoma aerolatum]